MRISVRRIQESVAADFGVSMHEFLSPCRDRRVCRPRQYAMLLARELTDHSLPTLGRIFGRDHTTVLTGLRSARKIVEANPRIALRLGARALLLTSEPQKTVETKFIGFLPDSVREPHAHPQDMHRSANSAPVAVAQPLAA